MDRRAIGERIRSSRQARGWRIDDLIERVVSQGGASVDTSHISRLERGQAGEAFDQDLHYFIARALGVSYRWLVDGPLPDFAQAIEHLAREDRAERAVAMIGSAFGSSNAEQRETILTVLEGLATLVDQATR